MKIILSILSKLTRVLKVSHQSAPFTRPTRLSNTSAKSKDEVDDCPYQPVAYEIKVEEIDQVEFVQEWGRTIVQEALSHATKDAEAAPVVDRRLPHFDRRQPHHDRRAGEGTHGKEHLTGHAPASKIDHRLPHYDRRHPDHDRRAGDGHDRRVHTWGAKPATGVERRQSHYDRRHPDHDRRTGNGLDRRTPNS
jgi:hypothetical protein